MSKSTQEQLRFPPVYGLTLRGEFDGGALSSDFGPMILRGVDRHIGLSERLAAAFDDKRHPAYITHSLREFVLFCSAHSPPGRASRTCGSGFSPSATICRRNAPD